MNYFFEIYTKHPKTGERGWDISVGVVKCAFNKIFAEHRIQQYFGKDFDCIIQLYPINLNKGDVTSEFYVIDQT